MCVCATKRKCLGWEDVEYYEKMGGVGPCRPSDSFGASKMARCACTTCVKRIGIVARIEAQRTACVVKRSYQNAVASLSHITSPTPTEFKNKNQNPRKSDMPPLQQDVLEPESVAPHLELCDTADGTVGIADEERVAREVDA